MNKIIIFILILAVVGVIFKFKLSEKKTIAETAENRTIRSILSYFPEMQGKRLSALNISELNELSQLLERNKYFKKYMTIGENQRLQFLIEKIN